MKIEDIVKASGYKKFTTRCWVMVGILFVLGCVLRYLVHQPLGYELLIVSFGLCSVLFYFKAFEPLAKQPWDEKYNLDGADIPMDVQRMIDDQQQVLDHGMGLQKMAISLVIRNFLHKLLCWSLAVGVISILFYMNHWPGADSMAIIALPLFVISAVCYLACYLSLPQSWRGHRELFV